MKATGVEILLTNKADDFIFGATGENFNETDTAPRPDHGGYISLQILQIFTIAFARVLNLWALAIRRSRRLPGLHSGYG